MSQEKFGIIRSIAKCLALCSLLFLVACETNPSPPAILGIGVENTDTNSDAELARLITIEMNLSATDVGLDTKQSNPFSLVIRIPKGAVYITGSSTVAIQGFRQPNVIGDCPNGDTYLLYDFRLGEINNEFDFEEFSDDVQIRIIPTVVADNRDLSADISVLSPANPCIVGDGKSVTLEVSR